MRSRIAALASCCLFFALAPASAQQHACLLEGSFTLFGQKVEIKDCLQNNGASKPHFVESCEGIADAAVAVGAPPAKTTYLASCPAQSLADAKTGCAAQGASGVGAGPSLHPACCSGPRPLALSDELQCRAAEPRSRPNRCAVAGCRTD